MASDNRGAEILTALGELEATVAVAATEGQVCVDALARNALSDAIGALRGAVHALLRPDGVPGDSPTP
jgi:hypothetical protein